MSISDKALEVAVKAWDRHWGDRYGDEALEEMGEEVRVALEAAAPYMLGQVEQELIEAKRVIALLVLEAGGKVALSRRAITELSDETVIETTQDVVNGGWVIRARKPTNAN